MDDLNVRKKPKTKVRHGKYPAIDKFCPNCMQRMYGRPDSCQKCGQKLRWK